MAYHDVLQLWAARIDAWRSCANVVIVPFALGPAWHHPALVVSHLEDDIQAA